LKKARLQPELYMYNDKTDDTYGDRFLFM